MDMVCHVLQCVGCISKQAGHRVGVYLDHIIPLIMNFCNVEDDELREYSIQAFESFVLKCPKEITLYVGQVRHCLVDHRYIVLNCCHLFFILFTAYFKVERDWSTSLWYAALLTVENFTSKKNLIN